MSRNSLNNKVSIIVPIYNVESFIERCINSIKNQTYHNLEIILVDDGSTDNTVSLLSRLTIHDQRFNLYSKQNGGVSSARNYGIYKATGEYLVFLDADDYISPDYIQTLVSICTNFCCEIGCLLKYVNVYNNSYSFNGFTKSNELAKCLSSETGLANLLTYKIDVFARNKIYKRDFLIGNRILFDESLSACEDLIFNIKAFTLAFKIGVSESCLYAYNRINASSLTTKFFPEKRRHPLSELFYLKDTITSKYPDLYLNWKFAYWRSCSDVFDHIILSKTKNIDKSFYKKTKRYVKKNRRIAFKVKTSIDNKIRALCFALNCNIVPFLLKVRQFIRRKNNGE